MPSSDPIPMASSTVNGTYCIDFPWELMPPCYWWIEDNGRGRQKKETETESTKGKLGMEAPRVRQSWPVQEGWGLRKWEISVTRPK